MATSLETLSAKLLEVQAAASAAQKSAATMQKQISGAEKGLTLARSNQEKAATNLETAQANLQKGTQTAIGWQAAVESNYDAYRLASAKVEKNIAEGLRARAKEKATKQAGSVNQESQKSLLGASQAQSGVGIQLFRQGLTDNLGVQSYRPGAF